jgi:hypothetical protein
MKKVFIITLLLLSSILSFGQNSPMDEYEADMQEEYRLHNIGRITEYILTHKETGKSEFVLDGKLYKMKVKESAMSGGYVRGSSTRDNDWIEGESLLFVVKHMHREYNYTLRGNTLQLWSDNLSFFAYYDFEKEEVSIRADSYNFDHSDYKMYGYDYSFAGGSLEKVQDWVVRDAIGRANSIKK